MKDKSTYIASVDVEKALCGILWDRMVENETEKYDSDLKNGK